MNRDPSSRSVAVIVCGTNEKQWLEQAFKTVLSSEFNGQLEVIYVDNNSHDQSAQFVETHFPSVHIIKNKANEGYSGANNRGIQKALTLKADYLFIINPDTASPKNLIQKCVEFMEEHPDFGVIGPMQSVYGENLETLEPKLNEWSQIALINGEQHLFYMDFPGHALREMPTTVKKKGANVLEHAYVQGAALFVRASLLANRQWFDATYHTFYEEVDLCRRIRWQGYRVGLVTDLFIQHKGSGSTEGSYYKKKLMMRNKYYYVITDPTWNLRQMAFLFKAWAKHDLHFDFPKNLALVGRNLVWFLFHLPKAIFQRARYKKLSKGRYLEMAEKEKDG